MNSSNTKNRSGPKTRYPWDKWLKPGTQHVLRKGRDFHCSIHSFVTYLYMKSSRVGRPISLSIPNDGEVVLTTLK